MQPDSVREADGVCNDLEDVHGQTNARRAARMHDLVNLGKLDDAAKHDDAETQALAEPEAEARHVGPVHVPHKRRKALLRECSVLRTSPSRYRAGSNTNHGSDRVMFCSADGIGGGVGSGAGCFFSRHGFAPPVGHCASLGGAPQARGAPRVWHRGLPHQVCQRTHAEPRCLTAPASVLGSSARCAAWRSAARSSV